MHSETAVRIMQPCDVPKLDGLIFNDCPNSKSKHRNPLNAVLPLVRPEISTNISLKNNRITVELVASTEHANVVSKGLAELERNYPLNEW